MLQIIRLLQHFLVALDSVTLVSVEEGTQIANEGLAFQTNDVNGFSVELTDFGGGKRVSLGEETGSLGVVSGRLQSDLFLDGERLLIDELFLDKFEDRKFLGKELEVFEMIIEFSFISRTDEDLILGNQSQETEFAGDVVALQKSGNSFLSVELAVANYTADYAFHYNISKFKYKVFGGIIINPFGD